MTDNGALRPRIGLSPTVHPQYGLRMQSQYYHAVYAAGGLPLILPLLPRAAAELLSLCDGLLLCGGGDVAPELYGERRLDHCDEVEPERDAFEIELLEAARAVAMPLLGVCRGIQLINVAYGGSLWQDATLRDRPTLRHMLSDEDGAARHQVLLCEPRLSALYGGAATLAVNSLHHQLLRDMGAGLSVAAYSEDGVVEAVCAADHRELLAVQWHPERMGGEQRELDWLIGRAAAWRAATGGA